MFQRVSSMILILVDCTNEMQLHLSSSVKDADG
jgi:hypothetical protein